jgi:hypothetical protein
MNGSNILPQVSDIHVSFHVPENLQILESVVTILKTAAEATRCHLGRAAPMGLGTTFPYTF